MVRRIADPRGELLQRDRLLGRLDQRNGVGDRDPVAPHLVGLAAQARAIPGGARFRAVAIESDMLALGVARGAARLAIDPGGLHRADEAPVATAVAAFEGRPGGVVVDDVSVIMRPI